MNIHEILWNNEGQRLTPELIVGILTGIESGKPPMPVPLWQLVPPELSSIAYAKYVFCVEPLPNCFAELAEQHQAQWSEVERVRQVLDPDYDALLHSEQVGKRIQFTIRDEQGQLVGNCGCYVTVSTHTKQLKGSEDTMYIAPEHRKGLLAVKFFKYCESVLLSLGVKEIGVTTKVTNDVHKLWQRQGYEFSDRVLTKVFEE